MFAVPLDYLSPIHPDEMKKIEDKELYQGPSHEVTDTKNFPSISSVVNESKNYTGMFVPQQYCEDFDKKWHSAMHKAFARDTAWQQELEEFLQTNRSNGRSLQLQVMVLPPGMFFKIHAHPNIEFEMTIKGCLEEFRFMFHVNADDLQGTVPKGPRITKEHVFQHFQVSAGECMLNEVGSVHQSFTGHQHGPCALLVLWSGCHANVRPEDVDPDIDPKLQPHAGWDSQ